MTKLEDNISVSIVMTTYNHEKFIAQAIESVLMQRVNFRYELVIGDDCSPDGTQDIIRKYKEKYPDKINAVLREKNVGMRANADDLRRRCRGKYMVSLEGDDYWTDPEKLQIQFDFLESHPEYIAVSHWCEVVDENGNISNEYPHKYRTFNFDKEEYTLKDYQRNRIPGHANTIMHRNIYLNPQYNYEKIYSASKLVGDRTAYLILTLLGKVYVMHRTMSNYRYILKSGQTNYSSKVMGKNMTLDWFTYYANLEKYVYEVLGKVISLRALKYEWFISSLVYIIKNPTEENKEIAKQIYESLDKKEMLFYLPVAFVNKIYNSIVWRMSK